MYICIDAVRFACMAMGGRHGLGWEVRLMREGCAMSKVEQLDFFVVGFLTASGNDMYGSVQPFVLRALFWLLLMLSCSSQASPPDVFSRSLSNKSTVLEGDGQLR